MSELDKKASALAAAAALTGAEGWAGIQGGADVLITAALLKAYMKAPYILAQDGAASAVWTGSLATHDFLTITIPGGALGPKGSLKIESFWTISQNANTKTVMHKFGGATINSWPVTTSGNVGSLLRMNNRNDQASQFIARAGSTSIYGSGVNAHGAAAIDTSVDQVLTLTGQLANASDTMVLEGYIIEIFPGF
ncbi:hypothetical protein N6H05_01880 [Sphingobium sp. WTD-1]|uniref:hypothetical protein n=1 Tax=Sphingobium sp. WTD-1 TaxID=2979467 RepID=UPI0024DDFE7C|nr:hypothetical protein [Sphingobium sp. WTD-1]WIA56600.1 hypothetical protein N6H05_01880 [Sphingobium sp. WTD-1]